MILLVPLDPVHDVGLKMIKRALEEAGHKTVLFPPDMTPSEIIARAEKIRPSHMLVSRTLGYQAEELLARLADLADAAGIREQTRMIIGGMAVRPELAQELGFDAGFGPGTSPSEVVAFIEGRPAPSARCEQQRAKKDLTAGYTYRFKDERVGQLAEQLADELLLWADERTSPAVERAEIRYAALMEGRSVGADYLALCDEVVRAAYLTGTPPKKTRHLTVDEQRHLGMLGERQYVASRPRSHAAPVLFVQYGTGCPFMDVAHIKAAVAWGADGVVHFDPSWGARTEGLLEGWLTHEEDGSVITPENLRAIRQALEPWVLWQVRAHRGLNTPETVVLAGHAGADLTKINVAYGSLGGGTDPERLAVDGVAAMRWAAKFSMPFDIVTNEELSGVPAGKAFASMLVMAALAKKVGARPILQPLFCNSPEVMIGGYMSDNYVDFNVAKVQVLRDILDAPVWPGAPVGFLTQTEDRVQSSLMTGLHACLAGFLRADAVTIASSDEAYSGGPITAAARTDTLTAVQAAARFFGSCAITPTAEAERFKRLIYSQICDALIAAQKAPSFVQALYDGVFGSREDGAHPGRNGRGTVRMK